MLCASASWPCHGATVPPRRHRGRRGRQHRRGDDPGDGDEAAAVLQKADIALYRAKADGRNRARFFEAWMDERQRRRRDLELHCATR